MKKNIIIIIAIILTAFILSIGAGLVQKIKKEKEVEISNKIKNDTSAFITRVLEEFNNDKNAKASDISRKIAQDFNKNIKNPYDKNDDAYTFEKNCTSCNSIEFFDSEDTIIISTYDKKGKLQARTIIKPPSFVTYNK